MFKVAYYNISTNKEAAKKKNSTEEDLDKWIMVHSHRRIAIIKNTGLAKKFVQASP